MSAHLVARERCAIESVSHRCVRSFVRPRTRPPNPSLARGAVEERKESKDKGEQEEQGEQEAEKAEATATARRRFQGPIRTQ